MFARKDKQAQTAKNAWIDALLLVLAGSAVAALAGYLWFTRRPFLIDNVFLVLYSLAPVPVIVAATLAWPAKKDQRALSTGVFQDVVYFFVMGVFEVVVVAWFAALLHAFYSRHLSFLTIEAVADWPLAGRLVLSVLVADFLNWLHHVVRHKVPWFWCFHTVHHSQREMNVFTDLRYHFMEYIIAKLVIFVPAFMLQLEPLTAFGIAIAIRWHTMAYHANLRTNYGLLRYIFVTPQSHRIHHSSLPEHRDCNFGVVFSIWDRMFGFQHTDCESYPETGIHDPQFPLEQRGVWFAVISNLIRQTLYPFRQLLPTAPPRQATPSQDVDRLSHDKALQ